MSRDDKFSWLPHGELVPCDSCDKPYECPILRIILVNLAVIDIRAAKEQLGLTQMFGNEALAQVMSSHHGVVRINEDPDGKTRIFLCNDCWNSGEFSLPLLCEKVNTRLAEKAARFAAAKEKENQTQQHTSAKAVEIPA